MVGNGVYLSGENEGLIEYIRKILPTEVLAICILA